MGSFIYMYSSSGVYELNGPEDTGKPRAATVGATGIEITSVDHFISALRKLKSDGTLINKLVIETHGSPGAVWFQDDPSNSSRLVGMKKEGFEDLFEADARIFLNGCNIADIGEACGSNSCIVINGRQFMRDFALTFLFKNGGRAGASTSVGLANPFNNKVYHLWGDTIYVYVKKGGATTRMAVGYEKSDPSGNWSVVADGGEKYSYHFDPSKNLTWDRGGIFSKTEGEGSWAMEPAVMRIRWKSGTIEEWELPLFSNEQPGMCKPSGTAYNVRADFESPNTPPPRYRR